MSAILPGATIGFLGGGQLARMMALEARRMGYRIAILDPDPDGPAGQVADHCIEGSFDDVDAAQRLAEHSQVVTLDTEHIPAEVLERIEKTTPVRPSADVLRIIQDRLNQRRFIEAQGAPQVRWAAVSDPESLKEAGESIGFPCILKTRRSGYDGKGQARIERATDLADGWEAIGKAPAVMEAFVDFDREISTLLARGVDGEIRFHPLAHNDHRHHILHISRAPADVPPEMARQAQEIGEGLATALGHIGMIAAELFVKRDGSLLVNEIAPRTHNSGHYTFGACVTSQFEQHVRATCGLPLGDPSLQRPAVMLNLLGDLWSGGEPDWTSVWSHPSAHLHLYGKASARPGRKMGHVLVVDDGKNDPGAVAEKIYQDLQGAAPRASVARAG